MRERMAGGAGLVSAKGARDVVGVTGGGNGERICLR